MKDDTKCAVCNKALATVYFSVVVSKGEATRQRLCSICAESERIKIDAPIVGEPIDTNALLNLIQKKIKQPSSGKAPQLSPLEKLELEMQAAIKVEDYEAAAVIRDKINALKPPQDKA